jgi:hypothetical protein
MERFEFAVGLFSVIIGLALTDMAVSTHRLLKRAREVRWSALTILTAAYVAILLVSMWYNLWAIQRVGVLTSFWFYASLVAELFLLFLLAAAVLPDEGDGVDLVAYFDRHQRYVWTLLLLFQLSYTAHWIGFRILRGRSLALEEVALQFLPYIAFLGLLVVRWRPVQIVLVAALIIEALSTYWAAHL